MSSPDSVYSPAGDLPDRWQNRANPGGAIIYHSGLNPKIQRNFEVFTPCDFIAAITQHIPDKSFQLVRYYGWYSKDARPAG